MVAFDKYTYSSQSGYSVTMTGAEGLSGDDPYMQTVLKNGTVVYEGIDYELEMAGVDPVLTWTNQLVSTDTIEVYVHKVVRYNDVKEHLRVLNDFEVYSIMTYIDVAVSFVENYTNLSLVNRSFNEVVYFAGSEEDLNVSPVTEITEVKRYQEVDGSYTEYTNYHSDLESRPQTITIFESERDARYKVVYNAGYTYSTVPVICKQGVLLMLTELFEKRTNSVKQLPTTVEYLLNSVKIERI